QTAFIGAGAVLGSLAPALFNWLGIANTAPDGVIPASVRYSFYLGAVAIVLSVGWTVLRVREYAPDEMAAFEGTSANPDVVQHEPLVHPRTGPLWVTAGGVLLALVAAFQLDKQLYVLGSGLALFGAIQIGVRATSAKGALAHIVSDLAQMPVQMKQLAFAQFFTWIGFFIVWIYTTPVVTAQAFGATDTASAAYNEGADWVGVMFAFYNGVAIVVAFLLPALAKRIGNAGTHAVGLLCGAAGFIGLLLMRDPVMLLLPMVGMGIAWASVLSMPYVILTRVLPPRKFGIYIGIFNFFVVIPQLVVATLMGGIMRSFFPGEPRWTMLVAALMMALAAAAMMLVRENSKDVAA
ncbi:MAG: MFS transporter, partial [Novosphingobium sp. 16-62-11]